MKFFYFRSDKEREQLVEIMSDYLDHRTTSFSDNNHMAAFYTTRQDVPSYVFDLKKDSADACENYCLTVSHPDKLNEEGKKRLVGQVISIIRDAHHGRKIKVNVQDNPKPKPKNIAQLV